MILLIWIVLRYFSQWSLLIVWGRTFWGWLSKGNNEEIYFYSINFKFITLNENDIVSNGIGKYLNIPQNKVAFYDFYIKMSN
jgi:hypothetical protein